MVSGGSAASMALPLPRPPRLRRGLEERLGPGLSLLSAAEAAASAEAAMPGFGGAAALLAWECSEVDEVCCACERPRRRELRPGPWEFTFGAAGALS